MKVVSVSVFQKFTPVLKGKETNPLLQINIETEGKNNPISLNRVQLKLSGNDIEKDIEKVEIYYTGDKPVLRDGILFGAPAKPLSEITISGNQQLSAGTNIFQVSVKLSPDADILHQVIASCSKVIINNIERKPDSVSAIQPKKFGVALRRHNDDGVHTYRIPGLETTNHGSLIAVYDVRYNNSGDLQNDIDVGMSRSTDGGKTWEPMKIIMDMGNWGGLPGDENGIGDPCILVDRQTGTIWVAALWAHGKHNQRFWLASKPGILPEETGQIMLVKSDDDGLTWSDPVNITSQVKKAEWRLFLQGPGKGINMQDGTLVFPAQFIDENGVPQSTIIYSRDHGKSWHTGNGAKPETTEAQLIELNNGSIMLNMRDNRNRENKSQSNGRAVYITNDLGKTWIEHPTSNNALIEPTCMGSLIKEEFLIDGKLQKVVLFSNPDSKYRRERMTIKISFDDGKNWPSEYSYLLDELTGNGYSCLTKIDEKNIGILYEGSQANLVFQIVPIENMLQQHAGLNYIFRSRAEGYSAFRIPAIVKTNSGRLLAFAEGRVDGTSDTGNIDLVMKTSDDNGKTWGPLKVVWNDGNNVCGNPAPVVDRQTGMIHLLMTWNLGEDHERQIIEQTGKDTRRVFVCRSADNGETWSEPEEITSSVKMGNWTWYATGPCHGIQLESGSKKGRLVIPCDHIEAGTKKYFSHVIYSDDHGKTWKTGGTTPQDQVNECTVAELPDGKLLLNMRNYDRTQKSRKISTSVDGGESWSDIRPDTFLIEPICQASLLASEDHRTLFFSNPANTNSRINMTIKTSEDEGKTWEIRKVLNSGASAYSDLVQIDENTLGCLYEGGKFSPYEGIVFNSISLNNN